MYEEQTFDAIIERLLEKVDSGIDKRKGSIVYNALAPAAAEIRNMYIALDTVLSQFYIQTATYGFLKMHGENFGLKPKEATAATVIGEFTPNNVDILGKTFSVGEVNYTAVEKTKSPNENASRYLLTCQTRGEIGNLSTGTLIPVIEVENLETAKIIGLAITGDDEEEIEEFRERLLSNIQNPAFGGNVADYQEKVLAMKGVGMVKVSPCTDGERNHAPGHVLIEVLDDYYNNPSVELLNYVQNQLTGGIDGNGGYGLAPIGHYVHVCAPLTTEVDVNIVCILGADADDTIQAIKNAVSKYFYGLREEWRNASVVPESWVVSGVKIINEISNVCDMELVWSITLDDEKQSYTIYDHSTVTVSTVFGRIPILNSVSIDNRSIIS